MCIGNLLLLIWSSESYPKIWQSLRDTLYTKNAPHVISLFILEIINWIWKTRIPSQKCVSVNSPPSSSGLLILIRDEYPVHTYSIYVNFKTLILIISVFKTLVSRIKYFVCFNLSIHMIVNGTLMFFNLQN